MARTRDSRRRYFAPGGAIAAVLVGIVLTSVAASRIAEDAQKSYTIITTQDVFVMDADGSDVRRLTDDAIEDGAPVWLSADEVAFVRHDRGELEAASIYVIDLGINEPRPRRLCRGVTGSGTYVYVYVLTLSRDGRRFAFDNRRHESVADESDIYVLGRKCDDLRKLGPGAGRAGALAWSADGNEVASVRRLGGFAIPEKAEIVAIDVRTQAERRLYGPLLGVTGFDWSPNGDRLVVSAGSERDANITTLSIFDLQAGTSRELPGLDDLFEIATPRWSPDGAQITFAGRRQGAEIYVVDADGSERRNLTDSREDERAPSWSPDGQRIAFVRELEHRIESPPD